jgi:sterol desaturase/sphingolipid hydroxylase (fatty acid hydroxylase superfamily)
MAVTGQPGGLGRALNEQFGKGLPFFVSLQFLILAPAIFALEHLHPARREERGFRPTIVLDAFYMAIHLPAVAAVAAVLSQPITRFLEQNAAGLVIDSTRSWPTWLMALIGLALGDLGTWFVHGLKHKVPLFWRFHMIHHSQARMSFFTANRAHPIDALIDTFVLLLPFFFLFPSFTAQKDSVFILGVATAWVVRFEHANVRTNLGPLRWIIVSPQMHRIHHSTKPEHWNSNYSNIFNWDRVLGTLHPDSKSYPPTGINDPYFPEPPRVTVGDFAASYVGQMLFPFDAAAVKRASQGSPTDRLGRGT